MLTLLKSLVQPKLDYCSQLWSPLDQTSINKLESVQRHLVGRIKDKRLLGLIGRSFQSSGYTLKNGGESGTR